MKKKVVCREIDGLIRLIPDDKKSIGEDLIKELVFMSETLDRLKTIVREKGEVEMFEQGRQSFVRENPALKSYNTTIQRYGGIYKQLIDLIPKVKDKSEGDDFDDFVAERDIN